MELLSQLTTVMQLRTYNQVGGFLPSSFSVCVHVAYYLPTMVTTHVLVLGPSIAWFVCLRRIAPRLVTIVVIVVVVSTRTNFCGSPT